MDLTPDTLKRLDEEHLAVYRRRLRAEWFRCRSWNGMCEFHDELVEIHHQMIRNALLVTTPICLGCGCQMERVDDYDPAVVQLLAELRSTP